MKNILSYIRENKTSFIVLCICLLIAGILHGINMFHFPYYENDEGVYMSQAWSLLKFGKLAPYTYWYDHAPAGWFLIGIWTFLTGGFFTFGFSINSGRVLMMILHVASSLFLFLIAKRLTKSNSVGYVALLIFSLTPLGIYFQRRVLLDNIMVFWLLLSLTLLLYYKNKLRYIILSALTFGIAALSKENAVFFIPLFLYIIYKEAHTKHKSFAMVKWIAVMGLTISTYFIYALLKQEFFSPHTLLGGGNDHVSLLDTLKFQSSRGGGSIFDLKNGSFWSNMRVWLSDDPVIIYTGAIATVANLLLGIKNYAARIAGIFSALMWIFLIRGGLVIEFYIIPLIPLLALNIAVFIGLFGKGISAFIKNNNLKKFVAAAPLYLTLLLITLSSLYFATNVRDLLNIYTSDQTTPQIEAVNWILQRDTPNTFYVIDNYGYIDLQEKKDPSVRTEWYWKVDRDPDIRDKVLKNNPDNIDYVALTPQMKNDVAYSGLGLTLAGWKNAMPVVDFSKDFWDVDFWGNTYPKRILKSSWESYKKYFIKNGRVIDPGQNNTTTSEGESYALLRAVWENDRKSFDTIWKWSKNNLQQDTGTFTWKYDETGEEQGTAPDADQNTALALLFASKRWNNKTYLTEARKIINGIWDTEVVNLYDYPYLTAGNWANQEYSITVNPSYLSPAHYRIFAEADTTHPWRQVIETSYYVLSACTSANLDKKEGVLPPEWCAIDKASLEANQPDETQPRSTEYSYNAFRTSWHVALDFVWFKEEKAKKYLDSLDFLGSKYKSSGKLLTAYTHDGEEWEKYESVAAYSGNLGYFIVTDPKSAQKIYNDKILKKFYEGKANSYWEDPKNYYTQNWGWFGTALYSNNMPNLWDANSSSKLYTRK